MSKGIFIFGAPGAGKTTLGGDLARLLSFRHIDLDDYYWDWDTEIPYTIFRPRDEIIGDLLCAVTENLRFVMSGSMGSIRKQFEPFFGFAVFITAPVETRLERVNARALAKFGERVLAGGDMHDNHKLFLAEVEIYDTGEPPLVCMKRDEQIAADLPCRVLRIDGTKPVAENAAWIIEQFDLLREWSCFFENR